MTIIIHTSIDSLSKDKAITEQEKSDYAARVIGAVQAVYTKAEVRHQFGIQSRIELQGYPEYEEENIERYCEHLVRLVFEAGEFWS